MSAPGLSELPKTRTDVIFRQLDDDWVLFDPRSDQLHVLNLSAAVVWAHCDGLTDLDALAGALIGAFEADLSHAQARLDAEAAVARFREAGLLE